MDRLLSLLINTEPPKPARSTPARAFYDAETESLTLSLDEPCSSHRLADMKIVSTVGDSDNEFSEAEGPNTVDENHKYSTVLLENKAKKYPWPSCCPSYRSADPDRTVTPFAVVLLAVLFAIYILNQADRLVLPVAIPSGLRCEVSEDDCRNSSHTGSVSDGTMTGFFLDAEENASNSSNETADCIHFDDYQQGLLTGRLLTGNYVLLVGGAGFCCTWYW